LIIPTWTNLSFFVLKVDSVTHGYAYRLQPSHYRVDTLKYISSQRVVDPWNSLPASKNILVVLVV